MIGTDYGTEKGRAAQSAPPARIVFLNGLIGSVLFYTRSLNEYMWFSLSLTNSLYFLPADSNST